MFLPSPSQPAYSQFQHDNVDASLEELLELNVFPTRIYRPGELTTTEVAAIQETTPPLGGSEALLPWWAVEALPLDPRVTWFSTDPEGTIHIGLTE